VARTSHAYSEAHLSVFGVTLIEHELFDVHFYSRHSCVLALHYIWIVTTKNKTPESLGCQKLSWQVYSPVVDGRKLSSFLDKINIK